MPYMTEAAPPVHTYVDSTTTSIKERLEVGYRVSGSKKPVTTLGAKLKFDPYGYAPPSAYSNLGKILDDDVHVVFVRRSYFEIFQTWKAFGIRHLANPKARKPRLDKDGDATGHDAALLNRFQSMHSIPLEQKRVLITRDGRVIARALHNRYSGSDTIHYSITDALDDLLVLFYNDIFALRVIANCPDVGIFYYQDIRARFFDVAGKLDLPVSADDCVNALDHASTSQIEPPGAELVFPDQGLKDVAAYLDNVFWRVRGGEISAAEVVRVDEDRGTVSFHLPGLSAILAEHEETAALLEGGAGRPQHLLGRTLGSSRRIENRYPRSLRIMRTLFAARSRARNEEWISQRPMYVPLAVAPAPTAAKLAASGHS